MQPTAADNKRSTGLIWWLVTVNEKENENGEEKKHQMKENTKERNKYATIYKV